jgi:hypothetical protein
MAVSAVPRRSIPIRLLAGPQCNPHWTNLSSDVQQQIVRLLARLRSQYSGKVAEGRIAEEVHDE